MVVRPLHGGWRRYRRGYVGVDCYVNQRGWCETPRSDRTRLFEHKHKYIHKQANHRLVCTLHRLHQDAAAIPPASLRALWVAFLVAADRAQGQEEALTAEV